MDSQRRKRPSFLEVQGGKVPSQGGKVPSSPSSLGAPARQVLQPSPRTTRVARRSAVAERLTVTVAEQEHNSVPLTASSGPGPPTASSPRPEGARKEVSADPMDSCHGSQPKKNCLDTTRGAPVETPSSWWLDMLRATPTPTPLKLTKSLLN